MELLGDALLRRWDAAAAAGTMRTNVNETQRRRVPGSLGLLIQHNAGHLQRKRPADSALISSGPKAKPTASAFNFSKANPREFLVGLCFDDITGESIPSLQTVALEAKASGERGDGELLQSAPHFVLINVAPLMRGHLLCVFDLNLKKLQRMEQSFLRYALSIEKSVQCEDFALGFNSAGAWSSVNHFHLQGFFLGQANIDAPGEPAAANNFPIIQQQKEEIFRFGQAVVSVLPHWPIHCFAVQLEDGGRPSSEGEVVSAVWGLVQLLQARGTPYNLLLTDSVFFIFPRKPQCENGVEFFAEHAKVSSGTEGVTTTSSNMLSGRLRYAVAELSGLIVAGDELAYENLTEEVYRHIVQEEVSLSTDDAVEIVDGWRTMLQMA